MRLRRSSRGERRVVVVGGGVSGLLAADRLLERGDVAVTLLEVEDRLGGLIHTEQIAGRPVDLGADSLVTRSPGLVEMAGELGLGERLIEPAHGSTMIWSRGKPRPLPLGLTAGLPEGAWPLARSGLISPLGLGRAALDLVLPRTTPEQVGDSLGELVRRRFGSEVLDRVVDPLLGGIHHSRCDRLSVSVVAPQFAAAARARRSLLRGLREVTGTGGGGPGDGARDPLFVAPRDGVQELVDALARRVADRGGEIRTGVPAEAVGSDRVRLAGGGEVAADGVIVAVGPGAAERLLAETAPGAAAGLGEIEASSVILAVLVLDSEADDVLPAGNGMLVPEAEGGLVRAATWVTRKWPQRGGDGSVVVRCSITAPELFDCSDDEVLAAAHADLATRIGGLPEVREGQVERLRNALPAPAPGHLDRIAAIEQRLAGELPTARLAGPQMRGSGIGACMAAAHTAADSLADSLVSEPARP